mmetsp:Transcript_133303/g.426267  ORF Transcript_133303/g.426267 Transcript_133303/m.426267 type:complete len:222 (-) Transcript_133303:10-675(-)
MDDGQLRGGDDVSHRVVLRLQPGKRPRTIALDVMADGGEVVERCRREQAQEGPTRTRARCYSRQTQQPVARSEPGRARYHGVVGRGVVHRPDVREVQHGEQRRSLEHFTASVHAQKVRGVLLAQPLHDVDSCDQLGDREVEQVAGCASGLSWVLRRQVTRELLGQEAGHPRWRGVWFPQHYQEQKRCHGLCIERQPQHGARNPNGYGGSWSRPLGLVPVCS